MRRRLHAYKPRPRERAGDGVRTEATGWRDEELSARHRLWGYDVPFLDLDFVVVEYDNARPVALIEYKRDGMNQPPWAVLEQTSSVQALRWLGNEARLPVIVVYYQPSPWSFWPFAVNELARNVLDEAPATRTFGAAVGELEFVDLLYRLRGRPTPSKVLAQLGLLPTRAAFE